MEPINKSADAMWKTFRETNPDVPDIYTAWSFGDGEEMADRLARLVCQGEKRGTTSLVWFYELDNEDFPTVDDYSVILDGKDTAVCIIKNVKVTRCKFSEVTEEMAYIEGEGDKSLHYWKNAHQEFFSQELKAYELKDYDEVFNEQMEVLFEEFDVVYLP